MYDIERLKELMFTDYEAKRIVPLSRKSCD